MSIKWKNQFPVKAGVGGIITMVSSINYDADNGEKEMSKKVGK